MITVGWKKMVRCWAWPELSVPHDVNCITDHFYINNKDHNIFKIKYAYIIVVIFFFFSETNN